jgi:cobalamin biosynthesis Mg chelatase CobN
LHLSNENPVSKIHKFNLHRYTKVAAAEKSGSSGDGGGADADACANQVAFCAGKGEIEGKCGATEAKTVAMCEQINAKGKSTTNTKGTKGTTKTTVSKEDGAKAAAAEQQTAMSAAASRVGPRSSWLAALAAVLCVGTTAGLLA